jgi:serine/threonine protein kinase
MSTASAVSTAARQPLYTFQSGIWEYKVYNPYIKENFSFHCSTRCRRGGKPELILLQYIKIGSERFKNFTDGEKQIFRVLINDKTHPLRKWVLTPNTMFRHTPDADEPLPKRSRDAESASSAEDQEAKPKQDDIWFVYEKPPQHSIIETVFKDRNYQVDEGALAFSVFKQFVDFFMKSHILGFTVGTVKLNTAILNKNGKIQIMALPKFERVTEPSPHNSSKNVNVRMNARLAFRNDIIILGYILGYLVTGKRPIIICKNEIVNGLYVRRNYIKFPDENLPLDVKNLLNKCLQVQTDKRLTITEIASHPLVSQAQSF